MVAGLAKTNQFQHFFFYTKTDIFTHRLNRVADTVVVQFHHPLAVAADGELRAVVGGIIMTGDEGAERGDAVD